MEQCAKYQQASFELMRNAGLFVAEEEKSQIETADFGLGIVRKIGLGVLAYVNTNRCCAKSPLQRGLTVEDYKASNVLRVEVTSHDLAEPASEMCGPLFTKTTAVQVPVDGGNERVI